MPRSLLGVTGCRDDASRATDGLPSAADAPLQRSELAKSATADYPCTAAKKLRKPNEASRLFQWLAERQRRNTADDGGDHG